MSMSRPYSIGQSRCHRWRTSSPLSSRAHAVGGLKVSQKHTQGRAEQEAIDVHMVQRELLKAVRALACCSDPMTYGENMLPDGVVEPLHQDRIALITQGGQHVFDSRQSAEDHPMAHLHEAPPVRRKIQSGLDLGREHRVLWWWMVSIRDIVLSSALEESFSLQEIFLIQLRCGKVILASGPCEDVRPANGATALA